MTTQRTYIVAFDTANEVVAIGIGALNAKTKSIQLIASREIEAHRQSNTQLLPQIDELITLNNIEKSQIKCVVCGRGPGSFTGVRIALSTAKGMASALAVPLYGISSLDVVAWNLWDSGIRGDCLVLADAMRKEVYPVRYCVDEEGVTRRDADTVVKAEVAAETYKARYLSGDALKKYADLFKENGTFAPEATWAPSGKGLLLAFQDAWRKNTVDPFDVVCGNPALTLPVYTRLSDAEENERIRLSKNDPKNLVSGVQDVTRRRDQRPQKHDTVLENAQAGNDGILFRPLDAAHVPDVAALETTLMGSDAWNEALLLDELPRKDRVWWAAYTDSDAEEELIGYAGGWIVDGQLQILKVATRKDWQLQHIAKRLLAYVANDARDLGARNATLEVRESNHAARAFYEGLDFSLLGKRPGYYSDKEDACIYQGPLPLDQRDVAGMSVTAHENPEVSTQHPKPWILAIETSCDETAAALIDGNGTLISDVLASQIDFHARFGGVVPEIASRKHVEAICGVTQECLDIAASKLGVSSLSWKELSAVAVTYAPGLVGALVVGVAFGKAAAWAADIPFISVNHLEGHIYANKIETPDIKPPMVVSLVSGGHTMLVHVKDWGDYEILGATLDDAVGEAFDKVAKALGLGYPGGPVISSLAKEGNPAAIDFPRAMLHSGDLRFSLSGLKTAVLTHINKEKQAGRPLNLADIAASFQQAVVDVQVAKARTALRQTKAREFCLGGGVAANPALRKSYEEMCAKEGVRLTLPPLTACTDNAGMIALVALDRYRKHLFSPLNADAYAQANLEEPY